MKQPSVSILIPTYNYARYLPEVIDSVLAQDFDDFELIIADDASSDNTVELCKAYVAKDPRIRFFQHDQNLGMVENWNWCLRQAQGIYIKYLLADDKFLKPYALSRLVEAIERPGIALATSARALIDKDSKITGVWNPLGLRFRIFHGKKLIQKCLLRDINLIGEPTAALFRRENAGRGFDTTYRQLVDLEMWFNLLRHGGLAYVGEPLCCFRQHPQQQTAKNRETDCHLREMICLFDKYGEKRIAGRFFMKRIHILSRRKNPDDSSIITDMKRHLTMQQFLGWFCLYRITRPFFNIRRAVVKRGQRALLYLNRSV